MIGAGFLVCDIGSEASAKKSLEAIKKNMPDILNMSVLLSTTSEHIREVINAVKQVGL